jgi:hypothetical protein
MPEPVGVPRLRRVPQWGGAKAGHLAHLRGLPLLRINLEGILDAEVTERTLIRQLGNWKWDRRDSNTGPTDPIRRGYHYPTVPCISTDGVAAFNLFVSIRAIRERVPVRRRHRCRRRDHQQDGRDTPRHRRSYSRRPACPRRPPRGRYR